MNEWPWVSRSFFHISSWPHGARLPSPGHPPPAMGRAFIPGLRPPGPCPQPGKEVGGPVPETTASPEPLLPPCSPCCPEMPQPGGNHEERVSPGPPAPTYTSPQVAPPASEMQTFFFSSFASVPEGTPAAQPGLRSGLGRLRACTGPGTVGYRMLACYTSLSRKETLCSLASRHCATLSPTLAWLSPPSQIMAIESLPGPLTPSSRPPQPSCFHSHDAAPSLRLQSVRSLCSLPNQCPSSFSKGPFCPHENPPCFPSSPTCAPALAPSACQPSLPCPPRSCQLLPSPICVPQRQEGQRGRPG